MTSEEIFDADERELRVMAARVLVPWPWKHDFSRVVSRKDKLHRCPKCGLVTHRADGSAKPEYFLACPVPDPAEGSLADIAERLRDKAFGSNMTAWEDLDAVIHQFDPELDPEDERIIWFAITASPLDRIRVLLPVYK